MAVKFRDYYAVLGVPRTASADEIKKAYRHLARKRHPDLQPRSERAKASQAFQEINEAYDVLSDPQKRAKYDALGDNWRGGQDFTPPPGGGGAAPDPAAGQWEDFEGFSDFFASLFGGGGRPSPGGRARGGARIPSDVESEMAVTLEELLRGGRRRISVDGERPIDVEIPAGVRDGTVLRLAGRGGPAMGGGPAGDLYIRLRLQPHPRYRVLDDDLELELPLWPWQAVLGDKVRTDTPDGAVSLTIPSGTQSGRRLRLRERGLPRRDGRRGDLYAVIRIVVPERPTADERLAYEALKQAATAPAGQPPKV